MIDTSVSTDLCTCYQTLSQSDIFNVRVRYVLQLNRYRVSIYVHVYPVCMYCMYMYVHIIHRSRYISSFAMQTNPHSPYTACPSSAKSCATCIDCMEVQVIQSNTHMELLLFFRGFFLFNPSIPQCVRTCQVKTVKT